MPLLYIIIGLCTLYAVYSILRLYGVFSKNKGASGLAKDIEAERSREKKRNREIKRLGFYSQLAVTFRGIFLPEHTYVHLKFLIERLEIRSDILDRFYTPEELCGKNLRYLLLAVIFIPFGVFFSIFWAASLVLSVLFFTYQWRLNAKVSEEDQIIDIYFIDLYLLLYSKLRMGSKARLQTVVESYIATLQVSTNLEMQKVMLKFARFFLNNLTMYEDHEAVPRLKERYRSAVIINFCNVATQALNGIDNRDTLLTLKQELVRKKTDLMKKNSEEIRVKGERSVYLIYIILLIFIAVGWYSKLPTGFF